MDARDLSSDSSPWMPFENRRRARDEKREAVLRTAVQLFLEQGYHRATLNEVAERLNITKPAALQLFPQQGGNPVRVLGAGAGADRRPHRRIDAAGGTGLARLHKLIHAYAEAMTTDYGASLVRFDPRDLTDKNSRTVRAAKRGIDRTFRKIYRRGDRGRLDPSARPQDDRVRDCRIAELDRPLVSARRRDVGGSRRRRVHGTAHRGAGGKANKTTGSIDACNAQETGRTNRRRRVS